MASILIFSLNLIYQMKKSILLVFLFLTTLFVTDGQAQQLSNAIGLRLGYPVSVTYKQFLNESNAFEIIAGTRAFGSGDFRYRWVQAGAAYQVHKPINIENVEGLTWYFGAGASVYFWNFADGFLEDASTTTFGIQGYLGLNYNFANTPINLTVDWIPTFFVNGYTSGFGADYGSFGIRYIIGRQ